MLNAVGERVRHHRSQASRASLSADSWVAYRASEAAKEKRLMVGAAVLLISVIVIYCSALVP